VGGNDLMHALAAELVIKQLGGRNVYIHSHGALQERRKHDRRNANLR
jgi:hypothetical protein